MKFVKGEAPHTGDGSKYSDWKIHPIAEMFPKLSPSELRVLSDSLLREGMLKPMWVHDGQIIDGRHRLQLCLIHGIKPQYTQLSTTPMARIWMQTNNTDEIPWHVVVDILMTENKSRFSKANQSHIRALTVAALLVSNDPKEEREKRVGGRPKKTGTSEVPVNDGKLQDRIKRLAGVGTAIAQKAKIIIEEGSKEQIEKAKQSSALFKEVYFELRPDDKPKPKEENKVLEAEKNKKRIDIAVKMLVDMGISKDKVLDFITNNI